MLTLAFQLPELRKVMIVRLIEPCTLTATNNWMITAEGLNDPADWSRFHPFCSGDSERSRFEQAVREQSLRPAPCLCKSLLKPGLSIFEYGWDASDDSILEHAIAVADRFQVDLTVGGNPFRVSNAA